MPTTRSSSGSTALSGLSRCHSTNSFTKPGRGDIAVRSFVELPTLLNSGGKRTEFSHAVVPGLGAGQEERLGGGVSGADVMGSSAGAQVLEGSVARRTSPSSRCAKSCTIRRGWSGSTSCAGPCSRSRPTGHGRSSGGSSPAGPAGRDGSAGAARTRRAAREVASGRRAPVDTRPSPPPSSIASSSSRRVRHECTGADLEDLPPTTISPARYTTSPGTGCRPLSMS